MSAHNYGYPPAPERPSRKSYRHHHHKSSDSGVGSSSDQDSYTTYPDWNYAVLDSAAAAQADDQLATIESLTEALRRAQTRLGALELKVKQADAAVVKRDQECRAKEELLMKRDQEYRTKEQELRVKEQELLKHNQDYRDLYNHYNGLKTQNEVLSDNLERATKEKTALLLKNKELEANREQMEAANEKLEVDMEQMSAANEKLESQRRKLERKLASTAAVGSSSSEDHEAQSPGKESRRKEGKAPSSREHREGRTRTSADPPAPRRSESKRRSTKPKDRVTDQFERAHAKAAAEAQARDGDIYEEPWGPSAPRRRRDSSVAATISRRMPALAIASPRADTTTYSDVSRSSRTDSNGYTRPSDIYVEDAAYPYRSR